MKISIVYRGDNPAAEVHEITGLTIESGYMYLKLTRDDSTQIINTSAIEKIFSDDPVLSQMFGYLEEVGKL